MLQRNKTREIRFQESLLKESQAAIIARVVAAVNGTPLQDCREFAS